jgi:UDP-glucose 4-epimerase
MECRDKKVLVTGGAGFIGSHLVDALQDCTVCVLDDLSTGSEANLAGAMSRGNVELIHGDVRDHHLVANIVRDVDVVFHLACRGVRHSIGHPLESHMVNAEGTLNMLAAARLAGVERFMHVSSSEVYGTARRTPMDEDHPTFPETVYGAAKLAGEAYARAYHQTYGLPTIIVRPFNNFGPRSHHEGDAGEVIPRFTVWALNRQSPIIFGDGKQTRDFIYVGETARWLRKAAECDTLVGGTINLGSGIETSIADLAKIIYEEVGLALIKPTYQPRRPGDVQRHLADVRRAQRILGFNTQVTVREGIRRFIDHTRSLPHSAAQLLNETTAFNWQPLPEFVS